ncbi:hypothetical protein MRX96_056579 [Rhipicephalus microplus]
MAAVMRTMGGNVMVARPRLPRHSFTQVKKAISRPPPSSLSRVRAALAKVSPPPACGDLLGSILEMQSVFHSKGGLTGAIVQRDGSLDLRAVPSSARKCPRSPPWFTCRISSFSSTFKHRWSLNGLGQPGSQPTCVEW